MVSIISSNIELKRFVQATGLSLAAILAIGTISVVAYSNNELNTDNGGDYKSDKIVSFVDMYDTNNVVSDIDGIIDIPLGDNDSLRVGISTRDTNTINNQYDTYEINIKDTKSPMTKSISAYNLSTSTDETNNLNIEEVVSLVDVVNAEIEAEKKAAEEAARKEAERQAAIKANTYSNTQTQGGLVDIANPDPNYTNRVVNITGADRDVLERLVMGEAGNQGFIGAALVAQALKDMYILGNYSTIEQVRVNCGYYGSLSRKPNQDVLDAVNYVFDQGGYVVKHRVLYFYAPSIVNSAWHESQQLVIQYNGHRFFDRWN